MPFHKFILLEGSKLTVVYFLRTSLGLGELRLLKIMRRILIILNAIHLTPTLISTFRPLSTLLGELFKLSPIFLCFQSQRSRMQEMLSVRSPKNYGCTAD